MNDANLFSTIKFKDLTLKNRIAVSPMCQYSSENGFANDWHFVHLGSRAVGGAGLVFTEATAVTAEGRISPEDLGIWLDDHIEKLANIVRFIESQGAIAGIQIAHAGRKASTNVPWSVQRGPVTKEDGGWIPEAPSAIPFSHDSITPIALTEPEIQRIIAAFVKATQRALTAGFKILEIHGAHGYLIHEFLSPLSNNREDKYGGSFENRIRFLLEIIQAVQKAWPEKLPLFVRISATDWAEDGWDIEQSIELAHHLKQYNVDLMDTSSGGMLLDAMPPSVGPGYQTQFAERIRHEAGIATGAVGMITTASQADHIIRTGQADMVFLARELLRDPYWPLHAAKALGHKVKWPNQYLRAAPVGD